MLEKAGKNSGDNRRDNRGLVLRMVATGACRTRRDLVVRTGLSKMTISNIVGEMIDGDVLRESEVVCSEEPGRNPVRLRLSPEAPKAAGVAFLPGRCESVLCGLDLRVFRRAGTDLPKDAPEAVRRETALRLLDKMLSGTAGVRAIGLAADLPWRPGGSRCVPRNPCVRQSGSGTASRYSWRTPARVLCWWRACSAGPGTAGTCCLSAWGTGWAARSSAAGNCAGAGEDGPWGWAMSPSAPVAVPAGAAAVAAWSCTFVRRRC